MWEPKHGAYMGGKWALWQSATGFLQSLHQAHKEDAGKIIRKLFLFTRILSFLFAILLPIIIVYVIQYVVKSLYSYRYYRHTDCRHSHTLSRQG